MLTIVSLVLGRQTDDVCFINVYAYARVKTRFEKNRSRRLFKFVSRFIKSLPARCIPILGGDFNAHVGVQENEESDSELDVENEGIAT